MSNTMTEGELEKIESQREILFGSIEENLSKLSDLDNIHQNPYGEITEQTISEFENSVMAEFIALNDWYQKSLKLLKEYRNKSKMPRRLTRVCCGREFAWNHQCPTCGSWDPEWQNAYEETR